MTNFDWKILEVASHDGVIEFVKYYVKATDGSNFVETEGYCNLKLDDCVNFSELKEHELIEYLKRFYIQNDLNSIESRLSEQLNYLSKNLTSIPPWHVETFKVEV